MAYVGIKMKRKLASIPSPTQSHDLNRLYDVAIKKLFVEYLMFISNERFSILSWTIYSKVYKGLAIGTIRISLHSDFFIKIYMDFVSKFGGCILIIEL